MAIIRTYQMQTQNEEGTTKTLKYHGNENIVIEVSYDNCPTQSTTVRISRKFLETFLRFIE